jgi:N-acetyl-anhydromuramyl-L-alanine amidase AmpD
MISPNVTFLKLPDTQYVNKVYPKNQIVVHHTASSGNPYGVLEWWRQTKEAVGTAFVIGRGTGKNWKDGEILQCFSSNKAGWHLGLKAKHLVKGGKTSSELNLTSVGIELCSWGQLSSKDGKFYTYEGSVVPESQVLTLDTPHRGYRFYQSYTEAQLESLQVLLRYLCDRYDITNVYKGDAIFDIDPRCLKGERGIWTHVSCRPDKFDCFPQKGLIEVLSSL